LDAVRIEGEYNWNNVDEEIPKPEKWLLQRSKEYLDTKNPNHVKSIVSCLDVDEMSKNSRSFRKFEKEVKSGYEYWANECGLNR
jgi:hypothetical protein